MTRHSIKPWTRKYVKGYRCFLFLKQYIKKQLLDASQNSSKNVVHKAGEFIGNKITDALLLLTIIISPEKREDILNKLRKVL